MLLILISCAFAPGREPASRRKRTPPGEERPRPRVLPPLVEHQRIKDSALILRLATPGPFSRENHGNEGTRTAAVKGYSLLISPVKK